MATTSEIKEKVTMALWPFHPNGQPEELVTDYLAFKNKMFKSDEQNQPRAQPSNPFDRPDNEELSFIGREKEQGI